MEVETVAEEYGPPMYSKKEFMAIVNDICGEKYTFLTINMKVEWETRFRRNLDQIVRLARLTREEKKDKNEENSDDKEESDNQSDSDNDRQPNKQEEKDEYDNSMKSALNLVTDTYCEDSCQARTHTYCP